MSFLIRNLATGAAAAVRTVARALAARAPRRSQGVALAGLDRRVLADIGIEPGESLSVVAAVGLDRLRRPPHI